MTDRQTAATYPAEIRREWVWPTARIDVGLSALIRLIWICEGTWHGGRLLPCFGSLSPNAQVCTAWSNWALAPQSYGHEIHPDLIY